MLQPHIRFCDKMIADALSPLPRACGASAHQLAAADAPCAASLADAFGCDTVALVLFPEAAAPASASPASPRAVAAPNSAITRNRKVSWILLGPVPDLPSGTGLLHRHASQRIGNLGRSAH